MFSVCFTGKPHRKWRVWGVMCCSVYIHFLQTFHSETWVPKKWLFCSLRLLWIFLVITAMQLLPASDSNSRFISNFSWFCRCPFSRWCGASSVSSRLQSTWAAILLYQVGCDGRAYSSTCLGQRCLLARIWWYNSWRSWERAWFWSGMELMFVYV